MNRLLLLIIFVLVIPANAVVISDSSISWNITTTNINFSGTQEFDTMTWGVGYMNLSNSSFSLNSSGVFNTTVVDYNTTSHDYAMRLHGTTPVNLTQHILSPNGFMDFSGIPLKFRKDGSAYNQPTVNATGWISNILTLSSPLYEWSFFDWWNSNTNDEKLIGLHPEGSTTYALLTGDIVNATWEADGESISGSSNQNDVTFSKPGHHTVTINALLGDGSTSSLTWNMVVWRPKSDPSDVVDNLNETWFDDLVEAMDSATPDFKAFLMAIIAPFTSSLGNLFYLFVYLLPLVLIWIRQEKALIPVGIGVIFGGMLLGMLPEGWVGPMILFMALTVFGIIYSLFKEKG